MTESEDASLRSILDDLIDLFGWSDKEYRDGLVEAGLWCEELQRFAEGE